MEILDNQFSGHPQNLLSDKMRQWLILSAKWAKFIGIVGFVFTALMVLSLLSTGTILTALSSQPGMGMLAGFESIFFIFYFLFISLLFFPALFLFQYAANVQKGLATNDIERLEVGLEKLKSYFKFIGILTIVTLSIYALIFVFALLAAVIF